MNSEQHCKALSWNMCRTIGSKFDFMNYKQLMAGEFGLSSCTIIFLWKSSFLFAAETEVMRKSTVGSQHRCCRRWTLWWIDVRECEFSMELKYCFSRHMTSKTYYCVLYVNLIIIFLFLWPEWKKLSLSWMFTKCLQAIFAQVFVTV